MDKDLAFQRRAECSLTLANLQGSIVHSAQRLYSACIHVRRQCGIRHLPAEPAPGGVTRYSRSYNKNDVVSCCKVLQCLIAMITHQMQHRPSLNVVVLCRLVIIHLLARKNQPVESTGTGHHIAA